MIGTALTKHVAHLQAASDKDIQVGVSWGGDTQEDIMGTVMSCFPDGLVLRSISDDAVVFAPFGSGAVFIVYDP